MRRASSSRAAVHGGLSARLAPWHGPAPVDAVDGFLAALRSWRADAVPHAWRVASHAGAIAEQLAYPAALRGDLERAALLHEVGKVGLPVRVLRHGSPLTVDEAAVLRTHVDVAQELLGAVPGLREAAAIVAASEERYNGDGYPDGLTAEEIPLGARILAVADAFEELTRGGGSCDDANAALVVAAGERFDPDVLRAWLRAGE